VLGKYLTKVGLRVVFWHSKGIVRVGVIFVLFEILQVGVVLIKKSIWRADVRAFHIHVIFRAATVAWSHRTHTWELERSFISVIGSVLRLHVVKLVLRWVY